MSEVDQNTAIAQEVPVPSVGEMLREARVKQNLEAADVARQLRLGLRQIEALEANDFALLPGNTIVRGFIRNYAKLLQLDPAGFLAAYEASLPQPDAPRIAASAENIDISPHPSRRWLYVLLGVLGVLIGAPILIYLLLHDEGVVAVKPVPSANAPVIAPVGVQPPSGETSLSVPLPVPQPITTLPPDAAAVSEPQTDAAQQAIEAKPAIVNAAIQLAFEDDSWVEVRDRTGNRVYSQIGRKGSTDSVAGEAPFVLVIGNANKVRVIYKGKAIDLQPYIKVNVARLTLE